MRHEIINVTANLTSTVATTTILLLCYRIFCHLIGSNKFVNNCYWWASIWLHSISQSISTYRISLKQIFVINVIVFIILSKIWLLSMKILGAVADFRSCDQWVMTCTLIFVVVSKYPLFYSKSGYFISLQWEHILFSILLYMLTSTSYMTWTNIFATCIGRKGVKNPNFLNPLQGK